MVRMARTSIMCGHTAKYLASILLACTAAVLMAVRIFGQTVTVTLVGAGDTAKCTHNNDEAHSQAARQLTKESH